VFDYLIFTLKLLFLSQSILQLRDFLPLFDLVLECTYVVFLDKIEEIRDVWNEIRVRLGDLDHVIASSI
jgi:hypothetical protein